MDEIVKYFPNITTLQQEQFKKLDEIYRNWNSKINVVSRKDIDYLYSKHVLHSLGIAKTIDFVAGSTVLDVGTGGGFPGIPLAIFFPETQFYLIDIIAKKIKVVREVVDNLELKNVRAEQLRAENVKEEFDFIVSRAVTNMSDFVEMVQKNIKKQHKNKLKNGILYLKGGNLTEELKNFPKTIEYNLSDFFEESFFETKKVIYLPI